MLCSISVQKLIEVLCILPAVVGLLSGWLAPIRMTASHITCHHIHTYIYIYTYTSEAAFWMHSAHILSIPVPATCQMPKSLQQRSKPFVRRGKTRMCRVSTLNPSGKAGEVGLVGPQAKKAWSCKGQQLMCRTCPSLYFQKGNVL